MREEEKIFAGKMFDPRKQELKDLNERRKSMTIQQTAIARAEAETKERRDDRVLVLYLPECHESLAGIIAGRIKDQ